MFRSDAPASAILDMAITLREFERQLGHAFGPPHRQTPEQMAVTLGIAQPCGGLQAAETHVYTGNNAGCAWCIAMRPAAPTKLGLIVLERWQVAITLNDGDAAARAQWWQRLTACFQKGGG